MKPGVFKRKGYLGLAISILLIGIGGFLYLNNLLFQQELSRQLFVNEKQYNSIAELNILQLKAIKDKRGYQIRQTTELLGSYNRYKKESIAVSRRIAFQFQNDSLKQKADSVLLLVKERYDNLDLQIQYLGSLPPELAGKKISENLPVSEKISALWEEKFAQLQTQLQLRSIRIAEKGERLARWNNFSFILLLGVTVSLLAWSFISIKKQDALMQQHDSTMRINTAVRASEKVFSAAFEYASIGMALVSPEGVFMRVNSSLCKLLGYSAKELKALSFQDITHPDDLNTDLDYVKQMLQGAIENYSMEKRYFHKNGQVIWINLSVSMVHDTAGKPKYFISQIENITDWKNTQSALEESEVKYRSLFENSLHGKILHDHSGQLLDVNEAALQLFGYSFDELKSMHFEALLDPADNRIISLLNLRNTADKVQGEITGKRKSGERFPLLYSSIVFTDKTGASLISSTVVDLSRQKETEKLLEQKNEELESFAYTAAHDLKEPLRMISSFMGLLKSKYGGQLDEAANKYVDFAITGSSRMNQLITDLLDYAMVGSDQAPYIEIDPAALLLDIISMNDSYVSAKSATINWASLPVIRGQKTPIQLLFQNLVINGLKYQPVGGIPVIKISGQELEDYWMFSVEDNGIGIPEEYHQKIFQVFSRLHSKDKYAGTGMGLATCKKIVELHGGKIWVVSKEGEGSCFYFTIRKNPIA